MATLHIDARRIVDSASFHQTLAEACRFPKTYGKNLDALVDCLGDLKSTTGQITTLAVDHIDDLITKHLDLYLALVEAVAFVNWRRLAKGEPPLLTLAWAKVG